MKIFRDDKKILCFLPILHIINTQYILKKKINFQIHLFAEQFLLPQDNSEVESDLLFLTEKRFQPPVLSKIDSETGVFL